MLSYGLAGAALSLALAGAAAAEPFQSFADLCLATDAEAHAATIVAKGAGWTDVTAEMDADTGGSFRDFSAYLNFNPAEVAAGSAPRDTLEILFTGWGDGEAVLGNMGVVLDLCGLMSPQAEASVLRQRVTDYLGLSSFTDDRNEVWLYSRRGDQFVSEAALKDAEDDVIASAAGERSLYIVYVIEEDDMAGLFVGAVRSEAKTPDR